MRVKLSHDSHDREETLDHRAAPTSPFHIIPRTQEKKTRRDIPTYSTDLNRGP